MNIVLIGMMGSGKTTVGKMLSEKLNMKFIDTDEYIIERNNMTIEEIFNSGEAYFRAIETDAIKHVSKLDNFVIACGGGVIKKEDNIRYLKKNGIVIFINRPIDNIVRDIDCSKRPLLSEGPQKIYDIFDKRKSLYEKYCDINIINDGVAFECVDKIINLIGRRIG